DADKELQGAMHASKPNQELFSLQDPVLRTGASLGDVASVGPVIDVHAVAEGRLRAEGQRYTRNHRAVVEALDAADRPLSLPELLSLRRDLVQSSAYRSVAVLEAVDVVHRVVTGSEFARFELAQELSEHHHHHR